MRAIRHILVWVACMFIFTTSHAVKMRSKSASIDPDNTAVLEPAVPMMTKAVAPGGYAKYDAPRSGTIVYPVALVEFKNRQFITQDTAQLRRFYDRMLNERGFVPYTPSMFVAPSGDTTYIFPTSGSVSDYYQDQSYGKFTPRFKVIGPIRLSRDYDYYGRYDRNSRKLMRELCDSIAKHGDVDLREFVRDGKIDAFSFIYAGRGSNYDGSDPYTLQPMFDTIQNVRGIDRITYCSACELFWSSDSIVDGIGIFCHEFAHTLGLPDFYNTVSPSSENNTISMSIWSLMDYGNYCNEGFTPVGLTAFEKYSLGWLDIEEITTPGHYTLSDISQAPDPDAGIHVAYRLNTDNEDDFIVLENHNRAGWYEYNMCEGMMVTAVSYNHNSWTGNYVNSSTTASKKRFHILVADNNFSRTTEYADLFPYNDVDSITINGQPQLIANTSLPHYSVYLIKRNAGLVSFYAGTDRESKASGHLHDDISMTVESGYLNICAPTGSKVSIHELSGKTIMETVMETDMLSVPISGRGIWLVKCGNRVRKLKITSV